MKVSRTSQPVLGFTLVELMIVVAMLSLLASLAVPAFARARDSARLNTIYSNLRALETAKEQWAVENKQPTGAAVADVSVVSAYLRWGTLQDVVREAYVPNPVGTRSEADLPSTIRLGPYGPGAIIPAP